MHTVFPGLSSPADLLALLPPLRDRICAGDDTHCLVERQRVLSELAPRIETVPMPERCATVLEELLQRVATPIETEDLILGRVVEGPVEAGADHLPSLPGFGSGGHLTPDYPKLLSTGLRGIAKEARRTAERLGTEEARQFCDHVQRCCDAICRFAQRYSEAALRAAEGCAEPRRSRLLLAARALEVAPAGPSPDFFSAIQAIWLVHLVLSCYVGARDFAFGRMDQYILPLYERGLADGSLCPDLALAYLAHFALKTKEITGTTTDNYRPKPVPCFASNQYVVVGGTSPEGTDRSNELSALILRAVSLAAVPQPMVNVRVAQRLSPRLRPAVQEALATCSSQVQFWNDSRVITGLRNLGLSAEEAHGYALTACNRADIPGACDFRAGDVFHNMAHWLLIALDGGTDPVSGEIRVPGLPGPERLRSLDEVLHSLSQVARELTAQSVSQRAALRAGGSETMHVESLLLGDCIARGRDAANGGLRHPAQYHFFGGVATVANSLVAIDELVFAQRRFGLPEFLAIVRNGFLGHEDLRHEIRTRLPKYGNGHRGADGLARRVCDIAQDALDQAPNPHGHLLTSGIYSLHCHINWGQELPATPDGRLRGEPISENQSPVHGTDREGLTALLASVAALPLERTTTGGLNVRLAGTPEPEMVPELVETFFALGGVHIGFTFVDRDTLLAAQARPDEFRTLCVRITGFSEYFVALSPEAQADVIARTEH